MPALFTSPIFYLVAVLLTSIVIYFLLTKAFTLSARQWKGLEFGWILISLLGVTSILEQNRQDIKGFERDNYKAWIKNGVGMVKSDLRIYFGCIEYTRSEYSPIDFDDRKHDQEILCKWSASYPVVLDSITGLPTQHLLEIDPVKLKIRTDQHHEPIQTFNNNIDKINSHLDRYNELTEELNDHFWQNFQRSAGLILILFAFAIRLTIATKNYYDAKPKEKQQIKPLNEENPELPVKENN